MMSCQCSTLPGIALQSLEKPLLSLEKISMSDSVRIFPKNVNVFSELVITKNDFMPPKIFFVFMADSPI